MSNVQFNTGFPMFNLASKTTEIKTTSGSSTTAFTALSAKTKFIRVVASVTCHFNINGAAAATTMLLAAGAVEYFSVDGGETPQIIRIGSDNTTVSITQFT
jgi:hypothetical protein|tara:strand:+ start:548 stop:850 length:303 start_codon:yes stop_codon:yes gene_type:complete